MRYCIMTPERAFVGVDGEFRAISEHCTPFATRADAASWLARQRNHDESYRRDPEAWVIVSMQE